MNYGLTIVRIAFCAIVSFSAGELFFSDGSWGTHEALS